MLKRFATTLLFLLLATSSALPQSPSTNAAPPAMSKVRTVTAFVRLNRATYQAQVAEALKMLRAAKDAFTKAGYEVETLRITTQPFPEYTKGLTPEQALEFFRPMTSWPSRKDSLRTSGRP